MSGQTLTLSTSRNRQLAHRLVDKAPPGAVMNIREATRTLEQNAKMHAMLSDIARAKPMGRVHDTETWKCLFMASCGFAPKWIPAIDGDGVVNTGYRSSRLTKGLMSELIEAMYAFGAQHGIEWSDPQGIEARSDETRSGSAVGESPVPVGDAEKHMD